jgi:Large polyvalent protein associated domain 29
MNHPNYGQMSANAINKKLSGYKTEAAHVASIIRRELKDKFPGIKFSVTSDTFSMGDSVRISFDKGRNAPACTAVEAVVKKHQAGKFNGMEDIYEYTNKTGGPTVKFVTVQDDYPHSVRDAVHTRLSYRNSPEEWRAALDAELTAQGY